MAIARESPQLPDTLLRTTYSLPIDFRLVHDLRSMARDYCQATQKNAGHVLGQVHMWLFAAIMWALIRDQGADAADRRFCARAMLSMEEGPMHASWAPWA